MCCCWLRCHSLFLCLSHKSRCLLSRLWNQSSHLAPWCRSLSSPPVWSPSTCWSLPFDTSLTVDWSRCSRNCSITVPLSTSWVSASLLPSSFSVFCSSWDSASFSFDGSGSFGLTSCLVSVFALLDRVLSFSAYPDHDLDGASITDPATPSARHFFDSLFFWM